MKTLGIKGLNYASSQLGFPIFLLTKFEDDCSIENCGWLIKRALINIANVLKSYVTKQDTKSTKAIPMLIWVTCALYMYNHTT